MRTICAFDYLEVVEAIYIDATTKCTADVSDLRDLETIRSRVKHEGMSFLTISLPRFALGFERSLATEQIDPSNFAGFQLVKNGVIPVFLQGILGQMFDRETGKMIKYEPPRDNQVSCELATSDFPTLVEAVRQICRSFAKIEIDCSPRRVQSALDSFYSIEQELQTFSAPDEERAKFLAVSHMLWDNMVADFSVSKLLPKHGPGATAEKITGNSKHSWQRWHDRLEPYFPLLSNGYPLGLPEDAEELKNVSIVSEDDEQPVRVVVVPKTLKSPRIIAIEPVCMQYTQQAIRDYLYDTLESYSVTRDRVNFRDQSINQRMALIASTTGDHVTIDLSEASDRVPLSLAMEMFGASPELRDSILACRSTSATLPDGRIIRPLGKFASMGSALCFPIEAMFFYTICIVALMEDNGLSYTFRNIKKMAREVYIYGDDIIAPKVNADAILDHLQKNNCKVNTEKTFRSGNFRESCGVDAFGGYVVTPTYIRRVRPKGRQQSTELISWCATANLFYQKGYWRTASLMFNYIEKILGPLPYVLETSSALGRYSFLGLETVGRQNPKLQRNEIFGWIPKPVYRSDILDGWAALTKCFLLMDQHAPKERRLPKGSEKLLMGLDNPELFEEEGVIDKNHLKRTALHGTATLKRRWAPTH